MFTTESNIQRLARLLLLPLLIAALAAGFPYPGCLFAANTKDPYIATPPFITQAVKPNVLIILDNSNSMDEDVDGNAVGSDSANSRSEIARQAVLDLIHATETTKRFGLMAYQQSSVSRYELHNSFYYCSYDPSTYQPSATATPKDPSSNTMRFPNPVDSGHYIYYDQALPMYASSSQGNGFCYSYNYTEDHYSRNDSYYYFTTKTGTSDPPSGVTSRTTLQNTYGYGGYVATYYFIPTDEDIAAGYDQFGEQLSWVYVGHTWFSNSSPGKGYLHVPIDDSTSAHITAIEQKLATSNFSTNTADHPNGDLDTPLRNAGLTPLAGTLESARLYFQGDLPADQGGPQSTPVQHWCQKNFVVLVTDGLPSVDKKGKHDNSIQPVVDEITALRSVTISGFSDPFDIQTFVLGFAIPPALGSGLDQMAVAGGTDVNGHAYLATSAAELTQALQSIFLEINRRTSAGTAISVLATSGEGEGTLYQAYFKPTESTATEEVNWTGYLQSLWVDALGNLREDWTSSSDHTPDGQLNLAVDPIVTFDFNSATGQTTFDRTLVDSNHLYGDPSTTTTHVIGDLSPLWEAGARLASRSADSRTIYTFVDLDGDGVVDGNESVDSGEFIHFDNQPGSKNKLQAFLDLHDDATYSYLGSNETNRVINLIRFIRGADSGFTGSTNTRSRTINSQVWKLGDIIHSTPIPVGPPAENFDLIYGDQTYSAYYKKHKDRETVVYVGANDGMLHAFLAGTFHHGASLSGEGAYFDVPGGYGSLSRGDEIWAYIPENLLPHLKWLADPGYDEQHHVYYVDLKPRVFDARIYENASDASHPLHALWASMSSDQQADRINGWATLLVGGMRLGGGSITVTGDFDNDSSTADTTRTFSSAYFCMDVTDPLHPILLWERNYPGLGFTTTFPAVAKVDNRPNPSDPSTWVRHWYLLFGSGPTPNHYEGDSTQSGRIFVVDLATGRSDLSSNPGRIFTKLTNDDGTDSSTSLPAAGFMGSPVAVDLGLDYSVDVGYIGETHASGTTYDGGLYRLRVPSTNVDPAHWTLSQLFDADFGITAAPGVAVGTVDSARSLWVYFGTGRYLSEGDKTDTTQQYLYGIKDPEFNYKLTDSERTAQIGWEPLTKDRLLDVTDVHVYSNGSIYPTTAGVNDFNDLKLLQDSGQVFEVGWYRRLEVSRERVINKPSVLGGILLAPSFVPTSDICAFGGNGYLYALYFETGTAYTRSVIGLENEVVGGETKERVVDKTSLDMGLASSLGIHLGREQGAKGFIQQSTGTITEISLQPAFNVQSGFVFWREQ